MIAPRLTSDTKTLSPERPDFSIVLGGPLYQLWRGIHLAGDALDLLRRRVIAMVLLAWTPLLVLSMAEGHAWGDTVRLRSSSTWNCTCACWSFYRS